jgi:hypothetical protein
MSLIRALRTRIPVLRLSLGWPASAAAQQSSGCAADSTYSTLDFWLGEWDVLVGDQVVGTNRITRVLKDAPCSRSGATPWAAKDAVCSTWSRAPTGGSRCG